MRIGNRLGMAVVAALIATMSAGLARAEDAKRVQPVPLGGALLDQTGDRQYGVYVPTKFGGELTIKTTSGQVTNIVGPDGKPRANGSEVGLNAHGWYTFTVAAEEKDKDKDKEKPYAVSTTFVQVGQSTRKPWNFYYWPTKADSIHEPWANGNARVDSQRNPYSDDIQVIPFGAYVAPGQDVILAGPNGLLESSVGQGDDSTWFPNQYDDLTFRGADNTLYATPSPMLKYDQLFRSSARGWEAANSQNKDISRWPGHCLGGAVASILLNEPTPAPGTGMTRDELKALWAELGENHYNHRIGDYATDIPPGPPRPGLDETDRFVPRFHAMLETHIRGQKQALLGNLRAFPPRGTTNEVWNHGIGKYTAKYSTIPGKGERAMKVELELEANAGASLNGQDAAPRLVKYTYTLIYGLDGKVDETQPYACDWMSVGGEALYCPLNILEVVETRWQGHNPYVTESNVRALDLANGGNYGRFSAAAPQFTPVGTYEAGRPAMVAGRTTGNGELPSTPRRGLFRIFGGR
jgi:hypothetical protein